MRNSKTSYIVNDSNLRFDGAFVSATVTGASSTDFDSKIFEGSKSLGTPAARNKGLVHRIRAIEIVWRAITTVGEAVYVINSVTQIVRSQRAGQRAVLSITGSHERPLIAWESRWQFANENDAGVGVEGTNVPKAYYLLPCSIPMVRPYFLDAQATHIVSSGDLALVVSCYVYYTQERMPIGEYERLEQALTAPPSLINT